MIWIVLALVAVLAGVAYVSFRRDLALQYERVGKGSHVIDSPFGVIEYALQGHGPTMLAIHGSGGGFDQGLEFAEPFLRSGFQVLAPSRFGYLRSSFPADPSPMRQADALAYLLQKLRIEKVIAVAVSAGAHSALELALRHPHLLSALILIVPSAYHPGTAATPHFGPAMLALLKVAFRSDFLFWAALKLAPDRMVRMILATDPELVRRQPKDEQRRARNTLRHILPVSLRSRGLLADADTASRLAPRPLETITVPTLTVSAPDDFYGTYPAAQYVAQCVANGRFVGFADGGHVLVGRGGELKQAMVRFLEEQTVRKA